MAVYKGRTVGSSKHRVIKKYRKDPSAKSSDAIFWSVVSFLATFASVCLYLVGRAFLTP